MGGVLFGKIFFFTEEKIIAPQLPLSIQYFIMKNDNIFFIIKNDNTPTLNTIFYYKKR